MKRKSTGRLCQVMCSRLTLVTMILLGYLLVQPKPLSGQVTAKAVRQAIDNGTAYLKRQQNDNGSWGEYPEHPGGVTSLCTLALLNSGLPPSDETISKSLDYIRSIDRSNKSTYAASLMTMALCNATPERDIAIIRENVRWLENAQITEGPATGGWAYRSRLSKRGRQFQYAICPACTARGRDGWCGNQSGRLATRSDVLVESTTFVGRLRLRCGKSPVRKYDLRRHFIADHR